MAAARKCSWEQCGKSAEDATLSPCGNCWAERFCSPACQKAGWPSHKTRCKESAWKQFFRAEFAQGDEEQGGGVRELFMGMAENDELAAFIDRDESEFYPIYLRDKFMTRGELTDSGIDKVLEERQLASRSKGSACPAAASVLNETFSFADTSTVSSAVSKLAERVAAAQVRLLSLKTCSVRESEILVEQQPPQGVFVCDHAGRVINEISLPPSQRLTDLVGPGVCPCNSCPC